MSCPMEQEMLAAKPVGQGTDLPWHQDGGDVWALDRDPLAAIWALDPATRADGCVEVVPGTRRLLLGSEWRGDGRRDFVPSVTIRAEEKNGTGWNREAGAHVHPRSRHAPIGHLRVRARGKSPRGRITPGSQQGNDRQCGRLLGAAAPC